MRIKDSKWEMTDDYIGMKPKFRVICSDCFHNAVLQYFNRMDASAAFQSALLDLSEGKFDMSLRETHCTKLSVISDRAHANNMHYKCCREKGCDRVKVFGVPIDEEYYKELVRRRVGVERVQPYNQWAEDEEIVKQLKSIGYL